MIYSFDITVPANTLEADPLLSTMECQLGLVEQLGVGFPTGSAGLLSITIWRDGRQVWPSNAQASFSWDDHFFTWPEAYDMSVEPHEFIARTVNLDDTFDHRVTVQVTLRNPGPTDQPSEELTVLQSIAAALTGRRRRAQ